MLLCVYISCTLMNTKSSLYSSSLQEMRFEHRIVVRRLRGKRKEKRDREERFFFATVSWFCSCIGVCFRLRFRTLFSSAPLSLVTLCLEMQAKIHVE